MLLNRCKIGGIRTLQRVKHIVMKFQHHYLQFYSYWVAKEVVTDWAPSFFCRVWKSVMLVVNSLFIGVWHMISELISKLWQVFCCTPAHWLVHTATLILGIDINAEVFCFSNKPFYSCKCFPYAGYKRSSDTPYRNSSIYSLPPPPCALCMLMWYVEGLWICCPCWMFTSA